MPDVQGGNEEEFCLCLSQSSKIKTALRYQAKVQHLFSIVENQIDLGHFMSDSCN